MKMSFILIFFLFDISIYAQDVIFTVNKEEIPSKIEEINIETISYKKFDNLNGPLYIIKKSDVQKIVFENGKTETFSNKSGHDNVSLEETKAFIVETINQYGYSDNGYLKKAYNATFENDYLRLILYNKDKTKELSNTLYDLQNMYALRTPDRRSNDLAYLNIYLPFLKNEKKDNWEKIKLVISVQGHENAKSLENALRHGSELLKEKNKKPGQKF